ncbi:hypothetical protein ILYODFUR_007000 [Ilyodon furcidens]|uniref:Ig-like domain-containing protein n=1 Tax=Ilyodon furcidens TaxID=33524 RepID=A0ABV0UI33_9TELE
MWIIGRGDDGPLPEDMELVGRNLTIRGLVKQHYAGLYECDCSYHHLKAKLQFNVTVRAQPPQLVSPTIRVDSQIEGGFRKIECTAVGAVPAASVSWIPQESVFEDFRSNSTFYNGSYSVLFLPICSPQELTALCVINHPAYKEPENRSITLPLCARPNITISLSSEWKYGHKYSKVNCSVVSVASPAAITWNARNKTDNISYSTETEVQAEGLVSTWSSVCFLSSLYAELPRLSVSVVRQQDSPLWLAVCDCKGEGVGTNLAWDLPANARVQVLNKTSALQNRYVDQSVVYRVSVNENQRNQKVLLRVEGNVPEYSLDCQRSDGSVVQLDGAAMILQSDPSGQNNGLYTCLASFYHHRASVNIQVEVLREEEEFMLVIMICISSASAIFIVFIVILCVCCKTKKKQHKERESISALTSLMQEPGSPEVRKPLAEMGDNKEYAQLTSFSIVFDAKSTV